MAGLIRAGGVVIARCALIAILLVAWELFARSGRVTMFVLPPLSAVLERIWSDAAEGDLFLNTGPDALSRLHGISDRLRRRHRPRRADFA